MKIKYLWIISLTLIILTIAAVSASDDIADTNLTVDDGGDDVIVPEDDLISSSDVDDEMAADERVNVTYDIRIPSSVKAGELDDFDGGYSVYYWFYEDDVTGNFSILVDDEEVHTAPIVSFWNTEDHYFDLNDLNIPFGNHTLQVKYGGDEKYLPFCESESFEFYYMKADIPSPVLIGDWNEQQILMHFSLNATGNLKALIDNREIGTYSVRDERDIFGDLRCYFNIDLSDLNLALGNHSYELIYSGGNFPAKTIKGNLTVDYVFDIYNLENNSTHYLDEEIEVYISLVEDSGKLTLTLNGMDYDIKIDDDDLNYILPELAFGKNDLTFTYKNSKYPEKQLNYTLNVASRIIFADDSDVGYNSDGGNFSIMLPSNAKGNLSVYIGGYDEDIGTFSYKLFRTSKLENGKATISVSDLNLGSYYLYANYTGNDYSCKDCDCYVTIIPNVNYSKAVWRGKDYNIAVESPQDAVGNLTVAIYEMYEDDYVRGELIATIYSGDAKGNRTLELPDLSSGLYYLVVTHSNEDYNVSDMDYRFEVRNANPNISLNVNIPSELVVDDEGINYFSYCPSNLPDDANGRLTLYIDGVKEDSGSVEYDDFEYDYEGLRPGNHRWEVRFSDDSYYGPASVNGTFNIVNSYMDGYIFIDMDRIAYRNINDKYYYLARIEVPYDADGNVTVLVDGVVKFNKRIRDCDVDENSDYLIYLSNITNDWELKSYRITVMYDDEVYGSDFLNRTVKVEDKYDIRIEYYDYEVFKGDNHSQIVSISGPYDAEGNVTVKVNGIVVYDKSVSGKLDYGLDIYLGNLTIDLDYGTYTIEIGYSGDKYTAGNITGNMTVSYPFYGYIDDGMLVGSNNYLVYGVDYDFVLIIPDGATGDVSVILDDDTYPISYSGSSARFAIDTTSLAIGRHSISAKYSGDANFPEKTSTVNFTLMPDYTSPYEVSYGEVAVFSAEVPDERGNLTLYEAVYDYRQDDYVFNKVAFAEVVDGVATITYKITKDMYYYLEYSSGNYTGGFIAPINIVQKGPDAPVDNKPAQVPSQPAQVPSSAPAKSQTAVPAKQSNVKLTVKKVTVKRSAKKLVLQVTVKVKGKAAKGKVVTFKFNGKTYKVKTNKKGVAKLVIKKNVLRKLKVGKKIKYQVSFGKTVKKFTLKVKK